MLDQRPYLLRALRDWIVDSDCTPQLLVDAQHAGLRVPPQAVRDGKVVLNVSPSAIVDLVIDDDAISFGARFGGVPHQVFVPMTAVLAVFARENGAGMAFSAAQLEAVDGEAQAYEDADGSSARKGAGEAGDDEPEGPRPGGGGSHLRVVK